MPCQEVYPEAEYPDVFSQFAIIDDPLFISSTEWFCLPRGNYDVYNDPMVMNDARAPNLGVYLCKSMGAKDRLDYDTSECI